MQGEDESSISSTTGGSSAAAPELAQDAVTLKSVPVAEGTPVVKGYDFNQGRDLDGIMAAAITTGFQVRQVMEEMRQANGCFNEPNLCRC